MFPVFFHQLLLCIYLALHLTLVANNLWTDRAEPGTSDLDYVLKEIYILYTDCALKDPFYELEMPIRCELFTSAVDALIQRVEKQQKNRYYS